MIDWTSSVVYVECLHKIKEDFAEKDIYLVVLDRSRNNIYI